MKRIYLDNNATTALAPQVIEAMVEELKMGPSNPSSTHSFGRSANKRLSLAREAISDYLGVHPQEMIFTGSGTEALNLAITGSCLAGPRPAGHIITSPIEHAAVHQTLKELGHPLTYLPVGPSGHVQVKDVERALTDSTSLIVLSAVNSETGVMNPIEEIAHLIQTRQRKIPFIVDGVALLGKESFSIPQGVSAMAFSGHKIHGPKGIGLLFARKDFKLSPIITGGMQERMRRAGTENLAGIIGFAKAIELIEPSAFDSIRTLRNQFEQGLMEKIPGLRINGSGLRVCNTSNLYFPNTDGETLLIHLDQIGIAASIGSACSSGALEPSRALLEMGCSQAEARASIRFSLSRFTTHEEITQAINLITSSLIECDPISHKKAISRPSG